MHANLIKEEDMMSEEDMALCPSRQSTEFGLYGEHMENTTALHRKLQSKMDALRILRRELEKFRTERDQFKLMAETLQLRYSTIKRSGDFHGSAVGDGKSNVACLLHDTRERNIRLTTEVEALRQKLHELQGDMDLLRSKQNNPKQPHQQYHSQQLKQQHHQQHHHHHAKTAKPTARQEQHEQTDEHNRRLKEDLEWKTERAHFICHLEGLKKKNAQLAFDLKTVIDEKEELTTERDAYKCKAHRLNHELIAALKANETHPKFLDIDSILLENKYLHERVANLENEIDITKQTVAKYKTMLEAKRKKGIIKLGSSHSNDESILSHKQVKVMLESGIDLPTKTETIQDLKALCLTLLDNLNDRSLALNHQKKTNKMLATKIAELEQRVQTIAGYTEPTPPSDSDEAGWPAQAAYAPSQLLLKGYSPALVHTSTAAAAANGGRSVTGASASQSTDKLPVEVHIVTDDSGTMSSETEDSNKTSRGAVSDISDGMSSLSTESGRSIMSSEYGGGGGGGGSGGAMGDLSEFTYNVFNVGAGGQTQPPTSHYSPPTVRVPSYIARQRTEDLKDLPPELAALVQQALHELDLRDFDDIIMDERRPTCTQGSNDCAVNGGLNETSQQRSNIDQLPTNGGEVGEEPPAGKCAVASDGQ